MIPDIVLEGEERIIVFDPKYRVQEGIRYFSEDFHEKYRMGVIQMVPGDDDLENRLKIEGLIKLAQ